ncbi:MAG: excinuclease ABC subunit UvrA [Acidobacteriota bacterium]|jgi:excinuclease ABC subunit A|nr:excinuclease ABC subunit UvrA [Acidobacteriota bacterium]
MSIKNISVRGARQHNLKNIDIDIPRNKFTVITGLSGSGKSSLAFDTIYAEGQRRYVESLSAYARQFLDQLEKPDVDSVEGLSPAISIEQKTVSRSPRSTVGTVTEIYDYIRLLFSSIGTPHCPNCDAPITRQTVEQISENIRELPEGERIMILAPIVRGRKGEFKKELEKLHKDGFIRARIDGELRQLDEEIKLKKQFNHTIEVVVDRLLIKEDINERLNESVKTALKLTDGAVLVSVIDGDEMLYSEKMACVNCKINISPLEPRSFSFNSKFGACKNCDGLGVVAEVSPSTLIPDQTISANKLPLVDDIDKSASKYFMAALMGLIQNYNDKNSGTVRIDTNYEDLPDKIKTEFFKGSRLRVPMKLYRRTKRLPWNGVVEVMRERMHSASSEKIRTALEQFISPVPCPECNGHRLRKDSLAVKIGGCGIGDYVSLPIEEAVEKFEKVQLNKREEKIAGLVLREIQNRLEFLNGVGLGYLTMDRGSGTLSGGEGQRIRLATQIGSQLRGVLYVLDEPSIGLHPRDNQKLLETLRELRDLGNTVLVVEHDEETIEQADFVIDLGPKAGTHGGEIVAKGTPKQILKSKKSLTGKYMSGELNIPLPEKRRSSNGKKIVVKGAKAHNLKNINVTFPLGILTVVTGVSGSGKSTLVDDILYRSLAKEIYRSVKEPLEHKSIEGIENVDKIIEIDQKPIGRTPRSNPATYTGVFTPIRELYAMLPESRERGYKMGRFSFNVKTGRCEACEGAGMKRIEMNFLPDVYVTCDVCRGKRYNRETLSVKYKGLSIADLLDTTIEDALPILENIPKIKEKLQTLIDVGLGYLKLGQSATTISGGEAQRVKLSKELSKRATGKTIYILDEPTTGLHFADVHKLLDVLQRLVDTGNTVIVIEHNLDVIKSADYIIDLGPEGGAKGGEVVAKGKPETVAKSKKSYTGKALREVLN